MKHLIYSNFNPMFCKVICVRSQNNNEITQTQIESANNVEKTYAHTIRLKLVVQMRSPCHDFCRRI